MTINITQYVDITSGVGAGAAVAQRNLVGRLFTNNELVPPKSFLSFSSAGDVLSYFGSSSEEYARAVFYFGWVNKSLSRAKSIQFARWVDAATAPYVIGNTTAKSLATYTVVSAGSLTFIINGLPVNVTGIDLSAASSLANVAALIQTQVRLNAAPQLATATISYDAIRGSFDFVGTVANNDTLGIGVPGGGTDLAPLLGWTTNAIVANGSTVESVETVLEESSNVSDNFGSFLFMPTLTLSQVTDAATWNKAQNIKYLYTVPVSTANASAWSADLLTIGGVCLTLSNTSGQYPEMCPMIIEAATDYTRVNAGQNYMFQQFPGLSVSVSTTADAKANNDLRINYNGRTQTAGQLLDFYQTGIMMGLATDPLDMNTYVNEIWLKAAATAALMTLLLAESEVSANERGRGQVLAVLQSVIDQALNNGVISTNKLLTTIQKTVITEISGDENAWQQVQTIGYWVDCVIVPVTDVNGFVTFEAHYILIYSKDDVIRKVVGQHVLI